MRFELSILFAAVGLFVGMLLCAEAGRRLGAAMHVGFAFRSLAELGLRREPESFA